MRMFTVAIAVTFAVVGVGTMAAPPIPQLALASDAPVYEPPRQVILSGTLLSTETLGAPKRTRPIAPSPEPLVADPDVAVGELVAEPGEPAATSLTPDSEPTSSPAPSLEPSPEPEPTATPEPTKDPTPTEEPSDDGDEIVVGDIEIGLPLPDLPLVGRILTVAVEDVVNPAWERLIALGRGLPSQVDAPA